MTNKNTSIENLEIENMPLVKVEKMEPIDNMIIFYPLNIVHFQELMQHVHLVVNSMYLQTNKNFPHTKLNQLNFKS